MPEGDRGGSRGRARAGGSVDGGAGASAPAARPGGAARRPGPRTPARQPQIRPPASTRHPVRWGPCRARQPRLQRPHCRHAPLPAAAKLMEEQLQREYWGRQREGRAHHQGRRPGVPDRAPRRRRRPRPPPGRRAPDEPREQRVRMTRLRRTIAARLKEAQNTAAMLTTFNEVDMSAVMALRTRVPRGVREEARRCSAGLHGLLRPRLLRRAEGVPAVNAESTATTSSIRISSTWASRWAARLGWWCR